MQETAMALIISPVIGFVAAALLLLVAKLVITNPALYRSPEGKAPPPLWIRALLVLTCTGKVPSSLPSHTPWNSVMGLVVMIRSAGVERPLTVFHHLVPEASYWRSSDR